VVRLAERILATANHIVGCVWYANWYYIILWSSGTYAGTDVAVRKNAKYTPAPRAIAPADAPTAIATTGTSSLLSLFSAGRSTGGGAGEAVCWVSDGDAVRAVGWVPGGPGPGFWSGVGDAIGGGDGLIDGDDDCVGDFDGWVVGAGVGDFDGWVVGAVVGETVGSDVVGLAVGLVVKQLLGLCMRENEYVNSMPPSFDMSSHCGVLFCLKNGLIANTMSSDRPSINWE